MEITKITVAAEINGKPYMVLIPSESKDVLIHMIQGISENGKLNVVEMPDGYKFEQVK